MVTATRAEAPPTAGAAPRRAPRGQPDEPAQLAAGGRARCQRRHRLDRRHRGRRRRRDRRPTRDPGRRRRRALRGRARAWRPASTSRSPPSATPSRPCSTRNVASSRDEPEEELAELAYLYEQKGLSPELARQVAEELTAHDALAAHAEVELGIDPDDLTNPWHAAWASMVAFTVGALPAAAHDHPVQRGHPAAVTVASVMAALALTGYASARLGQAPTGRAVLRNVAGGLLAMAVTHLIGLAVGSRVG